MRNATKQVMDKITFGFSMAKKENRRKTKRRLTLKLSNLKCHAVPIMKIFLRLSLFLFSFSFLMINVIQNAKKQYAFLTNVHSDQPVEADNECINNNQCN